MPVKRLVELMPEPKPHVNTVSTIVRLLEEKGCVGHRPEGKGFVYYAAVTPAEVGESTIRRAIARYFGNSYLGLVSALVKDEDINIDEIRVLLDDIERARAAGNDQPAEGGGER